jgi:serine protease AprX
LTSYFIPVFSFFPYTDVRGKSFFISADNASGKGETPMNQVRRMVHCDSTSLRGIRGRGIGIAIVDTGLSPHPDYRSRIIGWYDPLYGKMEPYDDSGHGSHVSGIAAGDGFLSHGLYRGIAPDASLIGVKVLDHKGNGMISDIMKGLQWILTNREMLRIRIVNISIGANDQKNYPESSAFVQKVNQLWDAGIVVIAAAGNKGPAPQTISAPGNSRKIITAGSYDGGANTSPVIAHSGTGPTLACIKKPDVIAPGSRIISCCPPTRT